MKEQIGAETVDEFMAAVNAVKAGDATGAASTIGTTNVSSSVNTLTYVAFGVAAVAILFAVFTVSKSKKK